MLNERLLPAAGESLVRTPQRCFHYKKNKHRGVLVQYHWWKIDLRKIIYASFNKFIFKRFRLNPLRVTLVLVLLRCL